MHCPHCNGEHPDNLRFCPVTGRALEQAPPAHQTCPVCGRESPSGVRFCPFCGNAFGLAPSSPSELEALPSPPKKHVLRWVGIGGAALFVIALALVAVYWIFIRQPKTSPLSPQEIPAEITPTALDTVSKTESAGESTQNVVFTAAAQTVNAQLTLAAIPPTNTPLPPTQTPKPTPTSTPLPPTPVFTNTPTPTSTPSGAHGLIAFNSARAGSNDIYVMNPDGSEVNRLTSSSADDRVPSWAPDGLQIAYQSDEGGDYEITIVNLTTRQVRRVTNNGCNDYNPVWSPDGRRFAFYSDCDGNREIYTISIDGAERRQLTQTGEAYNWFPNWSPDGSQIIFASNRNGKYQVWIMDADGANAQPLVDGCLGVFSPDGEWILYAQYCTDTGRLYLIRPDGSEGQTLVDEENCTNPSWSPDGKAVLFQSDRSGNDEIYLMRLEGSKPEKLTDNPSRDAAPVWQPGGSSGVEGSTLLGSAEIEKQMDAIQGQVMELRGLQSTGPVKRTLLTPEQLRQHVVDDLLNDFTAEEARDDAISLAAFGLLPADFDLRGFYIELFSEQVAGFYDNETKEMYVVQGEGFEGPERLTYSHEYNHVLQDQIFDIKNGLNYSDETCEKDSERCLAVQSLIEGDATILEMQWFSQYATETDLQQLTDFYMSYSSPVYDSAPEFMKEDFIFPYFQGQSFVQVLYDQGKWEAVDRAYQNLPLSSEQILHPERYPDDQPLPVDLPDLLSVLGADFREADRGVMGEWYTYLILAHGEDENGRIPDQTARQAAEGWGGDAYAVYNNDQTDKTVMVLDYRWDTISDAGEFARAFAEYATGRFGDKVTDQEGYSAWQDEGGFTGFYHSGERTVWIFAPDVDTAQKVWQVVGNP